MKAYRGSYLAAAVCVTVGALILHTALTGHHSTINLTNSLPQWVFSCRPYTAEERLDVGMYVRFLPPEQAQAILRTAATRINLHVPWIKQVTAIGEGWVFVEGTHPDSFDSRRWGPLRLTQIQEVCIPW